MKRKMASLLRVLLTRSREPFTFRNEHDERLRYEDEEDMGLYVHIPFCRSICGFCPYCKVTYDRDTARRYVKALLSEIRRTGSGGRLNGNAAHRHGSAGRPGGDSCEGGGCGAAVRKKVTSLYFGGGTPALLAEEMGEIVETLRGYFDIRGGIGAELHPEDVTPETLAKLKAAGVTMLSIGIQSFRGDCLELLGREMPDYKALTAALQQVSFDAVSMDLIFALPGQTSETLKEDIRTAFEDGADQIAIYPFIDFTVANHSYQPLPEREKKRMLREITRYCEEELGCTRSSVWTFGRPGVPRYSSMTRDSFLGFGVSAATLLSDQFRVNTFDIEGYISRTEADRTPAALTLRFTRRQRMVYSLFWNAYTTRLDPQRFQRRFGRRLESCYGWELLLCRLLGLAEKEGDGGYRMTGRGAYYYHYIEQFYTLSYIDYMWNMMGRVAFPEELRL